MKSAMFWPLLFTLQASCSSVARAMQHYPAAWGHYDVCKSQIYTEEGLAWDYMACQPEATDMTKYLRVTLDPPNITCGDPPETYCALVSWNRACPMMETNEAVFTQKYWVRVRERLVKGNLLPRRQRLMLSQRKGRTLTSASTRTRYTQVQKVKRIGVGRHLLTPPPPSIHTHAHIHRY